MSYYSQFGEDRIVETLLGADHRGSCVEVGANDGVYGSTSLYFEQLGWKCALVEPNSDLCRIIRTRRSSPVFECAASDEEGEAVLHVAEGAAHADGVSMLGDTKTSARRLESFGFTSRPVPVRMRRLDAILEEAGFEPGIDFVSIDVEGHEQNVLKGFSLDRWRPRILIIEDNSAFEDRTIRDYLGCRGYVPIRRTGVNDWYVHINDPLHLKQMRIRYEIRRKTESLRSAAERVKLFAIKMVLNVERRIPGLRALRKQWIR